MQWVKFGLGILGIIAGLLSVSACTSTPNLADVETSLTRGTTGASATARSKQLSKNAFDQQVRQAVQSSSIVARSGSKTRTIQAYQNAAGGAFLAQALLGLIARPVQTNSNNSEVPPYWWVSEGHEPRMDVLTARSRVSGTKRNDMQLQERLILAEQNFALANYTSSIRTETILGSPGFTMDTLDKSL